MTFIPVDALYRTAISTVLKSVGITARIFDIPANQGDLRQRVAERELLDLGVIVGASLGLEAVSHALGPQRKLKGAAQFLPQLAAYIFAEWFSRKATNYNAYFNSHLKHGSRTESPAISVRPAPAAVTSIPRQAAFEGQQPHAAAVAKPQTAQAIVGYNGYPASYWQPTGMSYPYY